MNSISNMHNKNKSTKKAIIKPSLQKNQELEVLIVDLGINAEGIAKVDNFTIFIPFALPSELVLIKIIKLKKNFAIAKLLDIITPSPYRVKPTCEYFGKCGGCNLLHLDYQQQLLFKASLIKSNLFKLAKLGEGDFNVLPTIGMADPLYYRNKASLPIRVCKSNNDFSIGFFKPRSHTIVEIKGCLLHSPINDIIIDLVKQFISLSGISIFDESSNIGLFKHIVTRINKQNQVMIILVLNTNPNSSFMNQNLQRLKDLFSELIFNSHNINVFSIIFNFNTFNNNVILGDISHSIYGHDYLPDVISNLNFNISPLSFFQVNRTQTDILYDLVICLIDKLNLNTSSSIIFDLYCGIGTISLAVAQKVKFVYGVEIISQAIDNANQNALINDISNVEFICGKSEEVIYSLTGDLLIIPDLVILDPPRKGCDISLINSIIGSKVSSIIYVSCDNATFSRDLKLLLDSNYSLSYIQPVDMFPFTSHVELVALIQKL